MLERLQPAGDLDGVREVRGVGLMLGVEVDPDRDTVGVAARALERGVVVRASGQKIVMSPPLVIEEADADRVVDTLVEELARL
jgi:adenosylmethionine-8-amino-7-oxononanoate aminotransferase